MQDIAARAGVSMGTVSHVINRKTTVRDAVRQRVQQAIDELGFRPNHLSRALRTQRTNLIGMVIPDITNPFFPSVVRGVEDAAYRASFRLLLCNADNDLQKESAYLADLQQFLAAGVILIPSADHKISWDSSAPLVCIDRVPANWPGDSVTVENFGGGYAAGRHLADVGHRIVGVIHGPSNVVTTSDRLRGFLKALADRGVSVSLEYIQQGAFDQESGYASCMRLLRLVPRPTALFAVSDLMAVGALAAVKAFKLSCPVDVSIISFDGLSFSDFTSPQLTSVLQPSYQLGHSAAQMLLERIQGDDSPPRKLVLPTELRIRDSVQAPSR